MLLLDILVNQGRLQDTEAKSLELDLKSDPHAILDEKLSLLHVPEEQLTEIRSTLYDIPIYRGAFGDDPNLSKIINLTQTKQLLAVPIELKEEVLSVGIVDPEYGNVIDALQFMFGPTHRAYKLYLISYAQFKEYVTLKTPVVKTPPPVQKQVPPVVIPAVAPPPISQKKIETPPQKREVLGSLPVTEKKSPVIPPVPPKKQEVLPVIPVGQQVQPLVAVEPKQDQQTQEPVPEITEVVPLEQEEKIDIGLVEGDDTVDLTEVSGELNGDVEKMAIPLVFNILLRHAIDATASDIHMEHLGEKVRVRFRIDGSLETGITLPKNLHQMLVARIKILCNMKLDEKRKPQDGRFSTKLDDHKIDYRVSTFPGYYGEKVVIRILDSYRGVRPLDSVALSKDQLEKIRYALARPYGIILISGPTGSGKTTTLYSMLGEVDKEHKNVVSLEDPIEYNLPSINQSQVFPEIGYTFASGLRSILRQDPDVIMVGEIRDAETAGLAIQAALTGHLVFSTIHTNTAIGVVTRLLDMGIEPYLIAPTLNLAIGQRLLRSIAPGCDTPVTMDASMKAIIDDEFKDLPETFKKKLDLARPFREAKPSKEFPTGMKGRVPVFEVLTVDDDIQQAILQSKGEEEILKLARTRGMVFMREDAMLKCMEGKIPFTEVNSL